MKSWIGPRRVFIDCYDTFGFDDENHRRLMIVMTAIGNSKLLKREWIQGRMIGGNGSKKLRCVFKTDLDPIQVKIMMLGLQYLESNEVPRDVEVEEDTGLFRFATFDVYDATESETEERGRLQRMLKQSEKKIELADLEVVGDPSVFFVACRKRLIQSIDESLRQRLLTIEKEILEKLDAEEGLRPNEKRTNMIL